jgi:hypothetical protein
LPPRPGAALDFDERQRSARAIALEVKALAAAYDSFDDWRQA